MNLPYTPDEIRAEVSRAQSEKGVAFFKNIFPDVPTWADFIRILNRQRGILPDVEVNRPEEEIPRGHTISRVDAPFYFYTVGGDLNDDLEGVKHLTETLREILGDILGDEGGPHPVGTFQNFAADGFKVPAHGDDRETFFWQCIGRATWKLYSPGSNGQGTPIAIHEMGPGDLLYIGHRVEHEVIMNEPRAGIAFNARV